jgi:hypothetical protein
LRYCFLEGGQPLLPLRYPAPPAPDSIPRCGLCGAPRRVK